MSQQLNPNQQQLRLLQTSIKNGKAPNVLLISASATLSLRDVTAMIVGCLVCTTHNMFSCTCQWHQKVRHHNYLGWYRLGDFASTIKREMVAGMLQDLSYAPYYDQKVLVLEINGAEMLTAAAAACLLKFLEEVKPNLFCFLLTTSRMQVLATIRSRAIMVNLQNDDSPTTAVYPAPLFATYTQLLQQIAHGQRRVIAANPLNMLERTQLKSFMFALFAYVKTNLTHLLTLTFVDTTRSCLQQLEAPQFSQRLIVYKWVNALNHLGHS